MWIFTAQEPQHCDRMPEASDTGSCRRRLTESLYPLSICYFNTRMNPRNEEYEVRFALLLNLHPIIFLWLSWNGLLEIFGLGPPTSRSKLLKNPFLRKRESMHSRNRRRGTAWATNFERCNKIRIVIAINSSHNIVKLYCTDLSKNRGIQSKRSRNRCFTFTFYSHASFCLIKLWSDDFKIATASLFFRHIAGTGFRLKRCLNSFKR